MITMRSRVETLLILFATCMECRGQDFVDQPKRFQSAYDEEDTVTLHCKYNTTSSNPTLLWYRQHGYDSPKYILRRHKFGDGDEATEFKGRFHSRHDSTSRSVPLTIQNPRVSDSALYYCALQNDGYKIYFGEGTKVIVQSKDRKAPQFYKFRESCLATDFTNHTDVEPSYFTPVRYTGKNYEKYYSSFALNITAENCKETDSECKGESSGQNDMELDEKINFVSLGLFWLRILLLKTVVFNILMTFKAWMS